jgi:tRNA A-37 threonylcarbamoyl transferase component Bud32
VQSVPLVFGKEGRSIHKQRNEIKVFDVNGVPVNVKQYKVPHFPNRVVYTFFRPPKAERAYRYALKLLSLGIKTPEPIAYILTKKNGLLHVSYYVSEQVAYGHTMYELGRGGISGREPILKAFAEYTAGLHESGIYHRDYSPGNILFQYENGETRFCLIDINRMRFGRVSVKKGCANFARLWGQEPMFRLLAQHYAAARRADPEKCIRWIMYYHARFWKVWARKHGMPFDREV